MHSPIHLSCSYKLPKIFWKNSWSTKCFVAVSNSSAMSRGTAPKPGFWIVNHIVSTSCLTAGHSCAESHPIHMLSPNLWVEHYLCWWLWLCIQVMEDLPQHWILATPALLDQTAPLKYLKREVQRVKEEAENRRWMLTPSADLNQRRFWGEQENVMWKED